MRRVRGAAIGAALAVVGAAAVVSPAARAQAARASIHAGVSATPGHARLGERVEYRGWVVVPVGDRVRWRPPEPGGAFTWGPPEPQRVSTPGGDDTVKVAVPLQVFALGVVSVPGLRFELTQNGATTVRRLPMTQVTIVPVIAAGDTAADLRPLRGPLRAPWWERVPWRWVLVGLLLIAAVAALVTWLRRRPRAAPAAIPAAAPRDPASEALQELAALRRLQLPAAGRFATHALHLTRILRRFLERTTRAPRPGDSTPELLLHLEEAALEADDLLRLGGLLRAWDRVKFARAPSTVDEAERAEQAVEALVRRAAVASEKVA
ncbi:MAG: hypothetical protein A2W00_06940 [Candidatus Eisenbacteria bacterium RBG_16_71_46]|nr:MAG: hypothetical protein A2W00_06940 [Candidatus Eisenbacteria bacterium RBG_16_71_46]